MMCPIPSRIRAEEDESTMCEVTQKARQPAKRDSQRRPVQDFGGCFCCPSAITDLLFMIHGFLCDPVQVSRKFDFPISSMRLRVLLPRRSVVVLVRGMLEFPQMVFPSNVRNTIPTTKAGSVIRCDDAMISPDRSLLDSVLAYLQQILRRYRNLTDCFHGSFILIDPCAA